MMKTKLVLVSLLIFSLLVLAACGSSTSAAKSNAASTPATAAAASSNSNNPATITVGSKNFTEEFILGELYAQMLENAGFKVDRKFDLGGTPVAQAAITSGQIDLYPEYTGTALLTVLKLPSNNDPQQVYQTVASDYKKQFNLIWLDQSPMNDTQALAMTQAASQKYGITTISQLVAKADQLTMIGPPEFEARQDGLPGLKKVYGDFQLKKYISVDPGLRYQGLLNGDADVVVAFGTDWQIAADDLVVLKDDKGLFPPYHVAPVVREDVLQAHPEVATVLNKLAPKLTDSIMQQLNGEVGEQQRPPADVAKEFLTQAGLIAKSS